MIGGFAIASTSEGEEIAYVDSALQGHVTDRSADVLVLGQLWERIRAEALPGTVTRKLIAEEMQRWGS